jgi:hypothetical protein
MSEIGEEEVCELACSQTLDGFYPNPLYASGACPDYMKSECNLGGNLFQKQWDMHQDRLKDFNAERMFQMSMGVPTQVFQYPNAHQLQHQYHQYQHQYQHQPLLPPTSSQVFATVRQNYPQKFQSKNGQPQSHYSP